MGWGLALTLGGPIAALAHRTAADYPAQGNVFVLCSIGLLGLLLLTIGVHRLACKIDDAHARIVLMQSPGSGEASSATPEPPSPHP